MEPGVGGAIEPGRGPAVDAPPAERQLPDLPAVPLPSLPSPGALWSRGFVIASILLAAFLLDQLAILLMDYWLLESLGFESVFWTNFWTGGALFAAGLLGTVAAVAIPARVHGVPLRWPLRIGVFGGLLVGLFFAAHYRDFLLFAKGNEFGANDPVFENDLGFYVFDLPAIFDTLNGLVELLAIALVASIVWAWVSRASRPRPSGLSRPMSAVAGVSTPLTLGLIVAIGVVSAVDIWFRRFELLRKDNLDSSIPNGAQALDVTGFFSTKNAITVSALVVVLFAVGLSSRLWILNRGSTGRAEQGWRRRVRPIALAAVLLPGFAIETVFLGAVALRDETEITPNEPVVQYPYIQRHIDATNKAWGTDQIERVPFSPRGTGGEEKVGLGRLFDHPTIQNAPLWPGYNSWLERQVDPEYLERIEQNPEDTTIYGPTLASFQQQEKLRPYYDFLDVDTIRYRVNGEQRLFASAVRELPLIEPQPWLAWWGQRFVVFTHGHGMVMAGLNSNDQRGDPAYESRGIPARARSPELGVDNEAVYYGEGSGSMGYSNVNRIKEHDFPTEQGRAEIEFPPDVKAGVEIDSPLKRVVFGWKSRQFVDIFFSDLIDDETRVHYFRTPLERVERIAPFLYLDTDPYAVTGGDRIRWMVNGMTVTNRYPYSAMADLGDKSDRRTPPVSRRDTTRVNYAADSVKGVVDAYTGQVQLYKFKDEPIVNTWQDIYPDLFEERESMPARIREQVQYPPQLFHAQFDDLYIYYHQKDALTFFSQEDLFDDGDEVVGPVLSGGRAITFSIEPYYWMAEPGKGGLPASSSPTQFAMSKVFTPESALNLRSIATVYMDGDDYGKLSLLEVPKGSYFPGPEQADAAIDQDAFISQQIGLWTRQGLDVIRGHTTPLLVEGEVIYIEPLFTRSQQNPFPQLKRVIVVIRGNAGMGRTVREALKAGLAGPPQSPPIPGPELGGDAPNIQELVEGVDRDLPAGVLGGPLSEEAAEEQDGGGPPPGAGPPGNR